MNLRLSSLCVLAAASAALAGCNGDHTPATYTVSGSVSGLTGSGLVLSNNGTSIPVSAAGGFSLATPLDEGQSYNLTVATQPTSPAQQCSVANGSGVANANVTNIAVTCVNVTYSISGTVSGLTGSGLVIANNGTNLAINSAGNFSLAAPLNAGSNYSLSVVTQPAAPAQVCTITNGSGVANANVSNIAVNCVTTPISIASSTPVAGAIDVARSAAPALTFSAPIDGATVAAHVTFKRGTHTVPAAMTSSGSTVTVTPQQPMSLLTTYTVAADTGLLGTHGEPTAANSGISFTTRDGQWHGGEIAKASAPNTSDIDVAMTSDRNFVAVWSEYDGAHANVWANTYVVGSGWGTAQQLQVANSSDELGPHIAADGHGHAYAVWAQYNGVRDDIFYAKFTVGSGWSAAVQLSASNVGLDNYSPAVAVNQNGDAVFAWVNSTGQDYPAWARYLPAGGTLGAATRVESTIGNTGDVRAAMDSAGNATVMWMNYDSINSLLEMASARYSSGAWSAQQSVQAPGTALSEYSMGVDSNDDVIAVWSQQVSNTSQGIFVSRQHAGGNWGIGTVIATTNDSASYYPRIAADAEGNLLAYWGQYDSSVFNVYSRYYTAAGGWAPQTLVGADATPRIVFDGSGNAMALWSTRVTQTNQALKSNRFTVSTGWATPTTATPGPAVYAEYSAIAVDADGSALVVWVAADLNTGNQAIVGSRFDDTPLSQ